MKGDMKTSLIIGSRNRPRLLLETVESVLRGTQVPDEIVIVDQSDVPHPRLPTLTPDRPCAVRYLWSHTVGVSRAKNIALAAARYGVAIFTDDDILVDPEWLAVVQGALAAAGPRAVITGRVLPSRAEVPGGFVPTLVVADTPAVYEGRINTDVLPGCHMAAYRSALIGIGGFDERLGPGSPFRSAEDNDLGFRLLEAGYRIVFVPEAVVYHRAWRPAREYLPVRWAYGVAKGGFYTKYLSLADPYMLRRMVLDLARRTYAFPNRIQHERQRAIGDLVYMAGVGYGAARWLLSQQGRRWPPKKHPFLNSGRGGSGRPARRRAP
ncbi:MAG TPA: glycosyltransferase [Chloroflexia bacterium]